MSTAQKLVMYHAEIKDLKPGDSALINDFSVTLPELNPVEFFQKAKCPTSGTYAVLGKVPDGNEVYYKCDQEGHILKNFVESDSPPTLTRLGRSW